jgi:UDP-GlcNAc:undecaprenyl-phosphate/decaprenyl-phosphate GlcNAc-1-phosphate transferase
MIESLVRIAKYPVVFSASAVVCLLSLWLLGRLAPRLGLLDAPRARHIHAKPIPLVGGLAIYISFFAVLALVHLAPWGALPGNLGAHWLIQFFVVGTLFVLLGVWDDHHNMKASRKLLGQILIAAIAYFLDIRFSRLLGATLPFGLDFLATIAWFLAFVNAFNLIDGMDGVAAGLAITGGLGLMILFGLRRQPASLLAIMAMLGACSVFLRYNFHPARYFLGDAGSLLLGAFFGAVSLSTNTKSITVASLGFPLLVVGIPLMDTVLAIWRRSLKRVLDRWDTKEGASSGGQVMEGDLDHLHHRLAARGYSQKKVALILYAFNAFLVLMGLSLVLLNSVSVGVAFVSFILILYVVVHHLATIELNMSGRLLVEGLHRPKFKVVATVFYPIFDFFALGFGSLATFLLTEPISSSQEPLRNLWLQNVPVLLFFPLAVMFFSGIYKRIWSRARVSEYGLLAFSIFSGCAAGIGILGILREWGIYQSVMTLVVAYAFNLMLVVGVRAAPRIILDMWGWNLRRRVRDCSHRSIVYGAGYKTTLLLRDMTFKRPSEQTPCHLLGIVDDDPNLWQRVVHGYTVHGGIEYLCEQMQTHQVDEVLVACNLNQESLDRVIDVAKQNGVKVERWSYSKQSLA